MSTATAQRTIIIRPARLATRRVPARVVPPARFVHPSHTNGAGATTGPVAAKANQTSVPYAQQPQQQQEPHKPRNGANTVLAVQQTMASYPGLVPCASAGCTTLALKLNARRVSIGWRDAQQCRPIATSQGLASLLSNSERDLLDAAMTESVNQQCSLSSLNPAGAQNIVIAQRALARDDGPVITVPLAVDGKTVGALCVEFDKSKHRSVSRQISRLTRVLEILSPVMSRMLWLENQHAQPRWKKLLVRAPQERVAADVARTSRRKRWLAISASALACVALLVPFDQHVNSDARVEGAVQRPVVAATNGYLKSVAVRPGDTVSAGQIIAALGERELELESDRLNGEIAQHLSDTSTAIAKGDRPAMAVAQSQVNQSVAELALVDQQLALTRVRAPIDGVVIDGDLWQSVGKPVDRGETLFTVAPADSWRVVIEVAETDITEVAPGQKGQLYLSATPWKHIDLTVERIAPMATTLNGNNVFEVHARLDATPASLRPGLRGTARIAAQRRNLLSRWTSRVQNAFARHWWRWQPW